MRAATDDGLDAGITTEVEFLEGIRKLAVKAQNSLVARVKFLSTGQDRDEKVNNYVSRLRGATIGCQFEVKCPSCQGTVSYQDQILHHQLVRGLVDPEVTEKVLANNMGKMANLKDTITYIETLEMAKRDQQTLSLGGGLN